VSRLPAGFATLLLDVSHGDHLNRTLLRYTLYTCIGFESHLRDERRVSQVTVPSYAAVYTVCMSTFTFHLASPLYLSGVGWFTTAPNGTPITEIQKLLQRVEFAP